MPSIAARWRSWEQTGSSVVLASPLSPVTFPTTPLRGLVEIAPGADLTADPSTWSWVDITQWVRHDLGISTVVGRRDQASTVDPSRATLKLDNRDGRFSRRNPAGPYYGSLTRNTPIRMAVDPGDGMHYRYYGFVNEWPKAWDRSGNDSTVTITCGGTMRRLQRSQPLRSALYRTMSGITDDDVEPLAYWPGEDNVGSTQVASGLPSGLHMAASGNITFAADSDLTGSNPLMTLGAGSALTGFIPTYTDANQWFLNVALNIPSEPSSQTTLMEVRTVGGTIAFWRLLLTPGSPSQLEWQAYDYSGSALTDINSVLALDGSGGGRPTETDFYGNWFLYVFGSVQRSGSVVGGSAGMTNTGSFVSVGGNQNTGTHSRIQSIRVTAATGTAGFSFGHLGVFTDSAFAEFTGSNQNASAMLGHAGELAHERIIRLCREESVPLRCVSAVSAALGPQAAGTLLDALREAERADLGVLYEHEFGLGYKSFDEYCNPPAQLALDFNSRHVTDPPQADDSDLRFRNQWTTSRSGGSSDTYRDPDYDPAQGLYEGSASATFETDAQLRPYNGWLVHRDTVDEDYWTGIKLRFHSTPDLIPAWTNLPYGSRLTLAHPPDQCAPDDIDAVAEGWTERWDTVSWEATLNTSPASVWRVGRVAAESGDSDPYAGRIDPETLTLAADVTSSATSWQITSDPLWSTVADDFPTDLMFAGERVTFTAVTGASAPQTATVTRSVNGVVKAQTAGTSGEVLFPFRPVP